MMSCFVPADRVASYHASRHKSRIDLIGAHLIQQRYLRVVIGQHAREWLRFATYLDTRGIALPLHNRTGVVEAYILQRSQTCRSASRTRVIRASVRIFLDADQAGRFRRRVGSAPPPMAGWLA